MTPGVVPVSRNFLRQLPPVVFAEVLGVSTGGVREPLDSQHLTEAGQVFRMAMYNDNVPGGHYRMANRVQVFDPPCAISWEPGMYTGDGNPQIVGHIWRYDLAPAGSPGTEVTLSYDWSAVPDSLRQRPRRAILICPDDDAPLGEEAPQNW